MDAEKELLELEKILEEALSLWEAAEELQQRIAGSDRYPKQFRAGMQMRLLEQYKEKSDAYKKKKEEYEEKFNSLQKHVQDSQKPTEEEKESVS